MIKSLFLWLGIVLAFIAPATARGEGKERVIPLTRCSVRYPSGGYLVVEIRVNNAKDPVLVCFDTGGECPAVLDRATAGALGLKTRQDRRGPVATLESVRIGDVELKGVMCWVADVPGLVEMSKPMSAELGGRKVVGFLNGTALFDAYTVTVDYEKSRLVLTDATKGRKYDGNPNAAPVAFKRGMPYIPVAFNGTPPTEFLIDTGAPWCFVPQRMQAGVGLRDTTNGIVKSMKFINHAVEDVAWMRGQDDSGFPILGSNVLSMYKVTIDKANGYVVFEPFKDPDILDLSGGLGVIFRKASKAEAIAYQLKSRDALVAVRVKGGGVGERMGLKEGAVVVGVCGKPPTNLAETGKAIAERVKKGDLELTILKDGKEETIRMR